MTLPRMTVLVVGATGSIGRLVVNEALRQGHAVCALVRNPGKASQLVTVRRLMPGDTLLMFSDGVTETFNPQGQLWNTDGLLKGLARHQGICGSDLLRAIDDENILFANGETPADDRTTVVAAFRCK